jgi:hypothetical protein
MKKYFLTALVAYLIGTNSNIVSAQDSTYYPDG